MVDSERISGGARGYSLLCHLFQLHYFAEAGDFTLGVASVLLLVGAALVPEVESLLMLLGRPELGPWADIPLPELVVPGVP